MPDEEYIQLNRKVWDDRVSVHARSSFYNVNGFLEGMNMLMPVELELLGHISGKRILHLQCHFGLDTLSLARMGAIVTGVDFSPKAIEEARKLATLTGLEANFVCSDIYHLPEVLSASYDIIFTSYGTIGWLPDLKQWASVVSHFMKSGSRFIMVDFHPVIWMLDNEMQRITYHYQNKQEIREQVNGTYADQEAPLTGETISWNHSLSELITALLGQSLQLRQFKEYDYSPYPCFQDFIEHEPGKFRHNQHLDRLPYLYALECTLI